MRVACLGIIVADVIVATVKEQPKRGELALVDSITLHNGGNAMTAAVNLRKMGVASSVVGKVGEDMFATFLRTRLAEAGVDTRALVSDPAVQTSASVALIDATGERSFLHCRGGNAALRLSDVDFSVIEECDLVFVTGTFLLGDFDGADTVEFLKKCKEMGKTTFLDVCHDASGRWGSVVSPALPYIDYFMPSIDEAVAIADGETDPDKIADIFTSRGAHNIVIKMGAQGAYLRSEGEEKGVLYPSLQGVTAVDTTGAGDSFCSGFLAAYANGEDLPYCMKFANTVGALCVTARGATTGTRGYEETKIFMEEHTC